METEGVTCLIANAGSFGVPGLSLADGIYLDDGLLDVLVLRAADIRSVAAIVGNLARGGSMVQEAPRDAAEPSTEEVQNGAMQHWQAARVTVETEPAQAIQVDGELSEAGAVHAAVIPGAIRVLVPAGGAGEGRGLARDGDAHGVSHAPPAREVSRAGGASACRAAGHSSPSSARRLPPSMACRSASPRKPICPKSA